MKVRKNVSKKINMGEFFPYIDGRYVNPYAKKEKDPTIRKKDLKKKESVHG